MPPSVWCGSPEFDVEHGDVGALGGERQRDAPADALAAAGDDGALAVERPRGRHQITPSRARAARCVSSRPSQPP
jgi:hypothetical protein